MRLYLPAKNRAAYLKMVCATDGLANNGKGGDGWKMEFYVNVTLGKIWKKKPTKKGASKNQWRSVFWNRAVMP